jgi:predicted transcriptional regulator
LEFFLVATDQPLLFSGRLQYSGSPLKRMQGAVTFETSGLMAENFDRVSSIRLTAQIVAAYLSNNSVPWAEIPTLITQIHSALTQLSNSAPAEPLKPAVSIKRSVTAEHIVCLEDGKAFKSLKRHLRTHKMTADQYRAKWNLPPDYPMVAPNYAVARSQIAKQMGLGQQRRHRDRG